MKLLAIMLLSLALFALQGCDTGASRVTATGGKVIADTAASVASKTSATGKAIEENADKPAIVVELAKRVQVLNGNPTAEDVTEARKLVAASASAWERQLAKDAKLEKENARLRATVATAPTQKEVDEYRASLDAFSDNALLAMALGAIFVLLGGFATWNTDNPKFFIYGVGASIGANLIPHVVKAIAESVALKVAIVVAFVALGAWCVYEWRKDRKAVVAKADAIAGEVQEAAAAIASGVKKSGLWARVVSWFS